jgi:2-pyrone-4,6-dicarboxylate lactonase
VFMRTAERVQRLGWHVVVYFEAPDLADLSPFLKELPGIVVVDHMGRPDVSQPVDGPEFARFVTLMEELPTLWTKVSCPERLTVAGPPYDDVVPFQRHLVERFSGRVLWGTDWPHPNMKSHRPDDGLLVDTIARIAPTPALQQALLIDNPMRLYWSDA